MSTYTSLNYHIVFRTKHRVPHIHKNWRTELHKYLAGTIKGLKGQPLEVGGVDDHVHFLVGLSSSHTIADFMRDLKSSTSAWVHQTIGVKAFAWQDGYAAFTVSKTNIPKVLNYIQNQRKHHRKKTFHEEYLEFLRKNGVDYDERYLWG